MRHRVKTALIESHLGLANKVQDYAKYALSKKLPTFYSRQLLYISKLRFHFKYQS